VNQITIKINEKFETVESHSSLADIIKALALPDFGCVFAINNTVIPRNLWQQTVMNDGDSISLFQAIAGG